MEGNNGKKYEASAELLDSILNSSTEYGIIATDLNDTILLWNKGAEIIYGYTWDEMIGKQTPVNLHRKDTLDNDILFVSESTFHSNIYDYKMNALRKDGSIVPVSATVTPRVNSNGETVGYLIIVRDITRIKLQEQFRDILIEITHLVNISTSVDEMCDSIIKVIRQFMKIPVVFICLFDQQHKRFSITSHTGFCNQYCSHSCNYIEDKELVEKDVNSCFLTYSRLTINWDPLSNHSVSAYIGQDMLQRDMSIIHIPILSDISLMGILHIVTNTATKEFLLTQTQILSLIANEISAGIQRKQLEKEIKQYANNLEKMVKERTAQLREKDAQLIQSGKLATLGEMATGIAHEINQPLGGINLITQGLLMAKVRGKLDDQMLTEKLNSILEQIQRIDKIIKHLRTFARQSEETKQKVNINDPILDVFKLVGQQLKNRNIFIELNLSNSLSPILADHNRLEQVFLNIISNARDALMEFEQVVIEIKKQENPADWINAWNKTIKIKSYEKDDFIYAEIGDNAGGIPKSILTKIFDPFFTTKDVDKGTGLGLSISYGIVKDFLGTIEVQSEEMVGSKFILKFPVHKNKGV